MLYARVATFQNEADDIDQAIDHVRSRAEADAPPAGLEGARMLMLVDRKTGKSLGISLFESEEALRRGDEALNGLTPGTGRARTSVEFFEVPVQRL